MTLRALLASLLLGFSPAVAATPAPCEGLGPDARALATEIMGGVHPHDCCDETLAKCLAEPEPSRLVKRLAAEVCSRVGQGEDATTIRRALERRAESMLGLGKPAAIDTSGVVWAGDPEAKVELIAYVCTRCPYCAKWLPELHRAVAQGGALHGAVRLGVRVFPLSSHEGAKEGGLALEAARGLGMFWPYTLKVMTSYEDYSVERLFRWAAEVGLVDDAFRARYAAAETREALVASKKEGLRNGVERTPTPFVDGKRYTADLELPVLLDVLQEEVDRVAGTLCQP